MIKMERKIFNIFFFLFLFVMINREFTPFGLDLRFICLLLALILLVIAIFNKRKINFDKRSKMITLFYVISLISNFMWFFNSLEINVNSFLVIVFSYIFNFICYLVFLLYQNCLDWENYRKNLFISLFILILSMICSMSIGLDTIFLSSYSGQVLDISPNFFGGRYRIAGFAQDPNYTSLFLILGTITALYQYAKNKQTKMIFIAWLFIVFYLLAASKTVLIAFIPIILFLILPKKFNVLLKKIFIPIIIILPLIIVFLNIPVFRDSLTMLQRLNFWNVAEDLFMKSPLIGNGLTSFRSYFGSFPSGWYVQCHSTIFQIISETGILSLLVFGYLLNLNINSENKYIIILTVLYSVYIINTETLYHIYSIFFIGILPLIMKGENTNE